ncbi:hypothetical protein [Stutzerimonas xanthomarina]|uniref:Uncharacterized protein n=2 Tax=Stutzerimonas xanthomarina TaxID=271420 RepID=A0A1M5MPZ9_9GAMM|nr:hypothetical protein [Stutzerimonas xanthomarina]MCP9337612.1 hypothetical protein [Stutzerimonas xanthomarina]SEH87514.1 hypothetical protein SAMN05216535_2405 [Stutzerimonas xanthomarina]SHG79277.1 hypothetical protein SAMN02744645_1412 [Stutzerimonas xanthomarina DSM 18231]
MTAKSAADRQRDKRERDRLAEEQRLARLLSRSIKLDLFKGTDAKLVELMKQAGIDEPQDFITRVIHGAHRLSQQAPAVYTDLVRTP